MGQERKVVTLSWTNWAALALKMRLKIWEVKHISPTIISEMT